MAKEPKKIEVHAIQDFSYSVPGKGGPTNVVVKAGTNLAITELEALWWTKRQLVREGKAPAKKKAS